jgi:hypothetical protein
MNTTLRLSCVLLVLPLLASCASRGPARGQPYPPPQQLYYDNGGGIQDSVRLVIRDDTELRRRWAEATSSQPAPPAVPQVDFGRAMVLLVAAGRLTIDDQVQVDSATVTRMMDAGGRTQPTLVIHVRTIHGCRASGAEAYPLQILSVQRFNGPVRFSERVERADCRNGAGGE